MYRKGMVGFSGGNNASFAREGGQGSQPLGAGRGPIRTAMANDSFKYSLKDRMAARRADKAMKGAMAPPADQGATQPTSRLDASPTPGLDAQNLTPAPRETPARQDFRTRMEKTMSGAFGDRAKAKTQGDITKTATSLRDQGMAMLGRGAKPMSADVADLNAGLRGGAPVMASVPATPQTPLQGRALAEKNIAEKGAMGAAADYFKRKSSRSSWKTPPPLTADMGKADVRPGKKRY